MKKHLALTAISIKLLMLLCVSGMGLLGFVQDSFAVQQPSPCHQEVVADTDQTPCDMCEVALEAWEENAVASFEAQLTKVSEFEFAINTTTQNFVFESKPFEGIYQAYFPPPQVLLKAVTPSTKNVVFLS